MKNNQYYKLTTNDRYLHLCGVPLNLLKSQHKLGQFNIIPAAHGKNIISPKDQTELLHELIARIEYLGKPACYAIGSTPDAPAYEMMTFLSRLYMNAAPDPMPEVKWIDLASFKDVNYYSVDKDPIFIVVHGLSDMSDTKRMEQAKDIIRQYSKCSVFVLVNTGNVYEYINKLGITCSGLIQLSKSTHRKVI